MLSRRKCLIVLVVLSLGSTTVTFFQLDFPAFVRGYLGYACPMLGLQNFSLVQETWPSELKCKLHRPSRLGCGKAYQYYGLPGHIEDRKCEETQYPDICTLEETERGHYKLSCHVEVCGSSAARIGSVDPQMGKVTKWQPVQKGNLTTAVQEAVKTNKNNGFGFLFIACGDNLQALTFPPILKKIDGGRLRSKINVNVIVLDSIARPHFYRILPRSVATLRRIAQDPRIKATALDFELFQSVGQQTFDNMRPFFSGVIRDDNEISDVAKTAKAPLGVEVLFGKFKNWSYQTLFQEDLCWYDYWGVGLTNLEVRSMPDGDHQFKERWREFQSSVREKHIDDFGLSHFSCTVLTKKYKMTNHYETPPQVCLNGKFYSQYFLNYISNVYSASRTDKTAKSILSFMHFNTGHEYTGVRMKNMDVNLAKFLMTMAESPDTLTLIFSDHGNRNTRYSYTEEGRRETFDPILFMLIPNGVAEVLGRQRMAALVENQRRLFTLLEVHRALMSLNDPEKINSQNASAAGIFAVLPGDRTCADLKLMPLTRCKCEGFDDFSQVKDNSLDHKWLAEFALGTINDAIQAQHLKGAGEQSSTEQRYGYGNCQRLVGKSFTNILQRIQGDYILTTIDLHVYPPSGYEDDEVFKVSLKHYATPKDEVWLTSYTRQSGYSKFESCADKSVDVRLCACGKQKIAGSEKGDTVTPSSVPSAVFGSETIVTDLDSGCLLLVRRNYGLSASALEVTNVCDNRFYKFKLGGGGTEILFSKILPIDVELPPKTFYFLTSTTKYASRITSKLHFTAFIEARNSSSSEFESLGERDV